MSSSPLKKRLKDFDYMMSDREFLMTSNPTMPDELIKYMFSWENKISIFDVKTNKLKSMDLNKLEIESLKLSLDMMAINNNIK